MAKISMSSYEAKVVNFLKDVVKKTLKKPILKATRKGKAPSEEVLEDTSVGGDKGFKANFQGWIRYFWREYADGVDEEVDTNSLKEGTNFVVGECNSNPYKI